MVGILNSYWDRVGRQQPRTQRGGGQCIKETRQQATASEAGLVRQVLQNVRLRRKRDRKGRMAHQNRRARAAVYPNAGAGMRLQEEVEIRDALAVSPSE